MLLEVTGDVFKVAAVLPVPAFAHGVNTQAVMGAGVALPVKKFWPDMFAEYQQQCRNNALTPGEMVAWQTATGGWVYNLATQDKPGRHARLEWVRESVKAMVKHARTHQIESVAMVRVGCGLGGLNWHDVRPVVDAESEGILLVVCSPAAST